jgi:putative hydrolase of the HAD superfamily
VKPAAVTFDCWSTLLYEPEPLRSFEPRVQAVARAAKNAGKSVDDETARLALDSAWGRHSVRWNDGQGSTAHDIAVWALEALDIRETEVALDLGAALGEVSLGSNVLALDGARDALARLNSIGIRTALICDTGFTPGRIIRVLLERVGLLEHLEVCIFSDEVGVPKPHRRMFEAALVPLEVCPKNAVHVGDLRRTDIAGARAAGMRAVRLRWHYDDDSEHPEADAVADSHAHLLEILGYELPTSAS